MTTMKRTCTLGLDSQALSDWRARKLPPDDLARIARHIPTCEACQHTLGDYDQIRQALRTQAVPATGAPLWHATQQTIQRNSRGTMHTQQKLFIAGGLGVLAVLVLSFAIIFASAIPDHGTSAPPTASISATGTPHSTATRHPPTVTATATPNPLRVTPAQGWVTPGSLSFGQAVAFSASDPLTGYICGSPLSGTKSLPMEWSVTHDGGRTWSNPAQITPNGAECKLTIDPVNPKDVVIIVGGCVIVCDNGAPTMPWRSSDGGATWQQMAIPTGDEASYAVPNLFTWQGSTLFVTFATLVSYAVGAPGGIPYPPHLLAVSINGQPLPWTHDNVLARQHLFVGGMYPVAGGIALYLNGLTGCNGHGCPIYTTTDAGTTWQVFTPTGAVPAETEGYMPDGSIVIGATPTVGLARSTDGGHTWSTLPSGFAPLDANSLPVIITSDGTIFTAAQQQTSGQTVFDSFGSGATQWRTIATGGSFNLCDAVSTLPDGTPNALWVATNTFSQGIYHPGIAYHAP